MVYLPGGGYDVVVASLPGTYGTPQGTASETGATGFHASGLRLVNLASIKRWRRPPSSVDLGQGSGFTPQAGE